MAEYIQKAVGGDLFRIETKADYPDDYYQCIDVAKQEMNADARPELVAYLDDISEYDNIFICGPCWWGVFPMAVNSLTDRLDFTGKKVMGAVTHEGSGFGNCEGKLKKELTGARFGKGLAIHGADAAKSEAQVAEWAKAQA